MNGARWIILVVVLGIEMCRSQILQRNVQGRWKKLNRDPLCIGAKKDQYASLRYHGADKFLTSIKFVHVSGQIRCDHATVHNSNWGCSSGVRFTLNIFLTDRRNRVIFPNEKHVRFSGPGKWYGLPGFDEISPTLVISDFATPFYLYHNQHMRIWYGEDLYDVSEKNNHGQTCMDIYGYLI